MSSTLFFKQQVHAEPSVDIGLGNPSAATRVGPASMIVARLIGIVTCFQP